MLILRNISKKYNDVEILKDINVKFRKQEFVCILGPSGCGKTTLLNIIASIEKQDKGNILLGDTNLSLLNNKQLDSYRSNHISYIFQNYNLINHLNISDNLTLNAKLKNEKLNKEQITKCLNDVGLFDMEKKYPLKLSGGEKQRVAIARSLISDTPIILADEPTGALDSKNSDKIMGLLASLALQKLVIVVTHNEKIAKKYAKRIIKLGDGQIVSDSDPYQELDEVSYENKKTKLKFLMAFKVSYNNLKNKKVRSYLMTLAFSIGLISLALVLSVSNGFKKEINIFEKQGLYDYPLIISKESINIENIFTKDNTGYDNEFINIKENQTIVNNVIDEQLISLIEGINKNLVGGIAYYKDLPIEFKNIAYVNPNNDYFDLLQGRFPENNHEILLLVDTNQAIDKRVASFLKIDKIRLEEIIDQYIEVASVGLHIVGVVKSNVNYFIDSSGVLYNSEAFNSEITDIHLYARNYDSKEKLKALLNDYYVNDEAKTVVNLTATLVNGITLVLIIFSIISLIVSIIMIGIVTYISVLERQKEIGLLKTMGASNKDIKKIFLAENMLIGILASIISLEVTFSISKIINKYIAGKISLQNIANPNYKVILYTIIISLSLTYLAGLIPARIASNKRIVNILNNE